MAAKSNSIRFGGFCVILILLFCTCPIPDNSTTDTSQSDDRKTYVIFSNNTEYDVNVYVALPPTEDSVPFAQVPAGNITMEWEIQPSQNDNGDAFYFEYNIPVGDSIKLPFYKDNVKFKRIEAKKTNTIAVDPLQFVSTSSIFLVVENIHTSDDIWLVQGSNPQYPAGLAHDESSRWIKPGKEAVYRFTSLADLNILSIRHNTATHPLPSVICNDNRVYTIRYDGTEPVLFSVTSLDPTIKNKIWTIPTSTNTGTYFTTSLLAPRGNINDGYILTGRTSYSFYTVFPTAGSAAYLGILAPDGSLVLERKITLNNPSVSLNIQGFIENSDELIFAGQAYEEQNDGFPFILNTGLNGVSNVFYTGFIDDIDTATQALYGNRIVKNDTGYALGAELYDYDRVMSQIYIACISQENWDTAQHTKIWTSPETDDTYFIDLKYDTAQQTYIVLAGDYTKAAEGQLGSFLYFVNADGVQKSRIFFDKYEISTIFILNGEYYAAGTYIGASGYRGIINKLEISAGTFGPNPWLVDSKYTSGAAGIVNTVLETDGTVVLGGWCVENFADQGEWWRKGQPWLIKYDLTTSQKIWEEVYDYTGYYIYSVHHNAIGSYLVEINNEATYESRLISTDLMGKTSDKRLAAIPRNALVFTVSVPNASHISARKRDTASDWE
jgi:hypothetical protein